MDVIHVVETLTSGRQQVDFFLKMHRPLPRRGLTHVEIGHPMIRPELVSRYSHRTLKGVSGCTKCRSLLHHLLREVME